jgi:glycerate 2-kinase
MTQQKNLNSDLRLIVDRTIRAIQPDKLVEEGVRNLHLENKKLFVVSVGKAAWTMARASLNLLEDRIVGGIVITKYEHSEGPLRDFEIYEAGHPQPDKNTYRATQKVLDTCQSLDADTEILMLISGGASALFELPLIDTELYEAINVELVGSGAGIEDINTVRKRFSGVKGGKFAAALMPRPIWAIILSDVLGDSVETVASGPVSTDTSDLVMAKAVANKFDLKVTAEALDALEKQALREGKQKLLEAVEVKNAKTYIGGSVSLLCELTAEIVEDLGYRPILLTDRLDCEAREAGKFLASIGLSHSQSKENVAFIAGGETVVTLKGKGKGGRNQELALAASKTLAGTKNVLLFSLGSDGTDGPTDAAGGFVDGQTWAKLEENGLNVDEVLADNNAYVALDSIGGLLKTGPTGSNINDVSVVLVRKDSDL